MKAPDKIHLTNGDPEHLINFDTDAANGLVMWCEDKITDHDVEYIRKDALLEWAKEQFEYYKKIDEDFDGDVFIGNRHAFSEMISKINSL